MEKDYVESSGNVFADMGLPDAEDALAKAELACLIELAIKAKGMTQKQAAEVLGIDQPKVSAVVRGRLSGFSLDRLMRFLVLLGNDVEIVVKEKAKEDAPARLRVA